MTETPLPGMPATPEETHGCDCDAKLADLSRAVELQNDKLSELTQAVNTVGSMVQSIMDNASGFLSQFKGMNPLDILKGAIGGRR